MPRKRALLVEPDEATCVAVKAILEGLGFDVVTMSDGESAVSVFNYVEADVVLTHYPSGKRSSENLIGHIRKYSQNPTTPILAVLAPGDRVRARDALSDGCDDVILRPVEAIVLRSKLRHLTGEPLPDPTPPEAAPPEASQPATSQPLADSPTPTPDSLTPRPEPT